MARARSEPKVEPKTPEHRVRAVTTREVVYERDGEKRVAATVDSDSVRLRIAHYGRASMYPRTDSTIPNEQFDELVCAIDRQRRLAKGDCCQ